MRYSKEHKEETRRRLVAAAAQVLKTAGLNGASVERISQAAGVTHGAIYKHFGSKEDLLREALPLATADFRERFAAEAGDAGAIATYLSPRHRDSGADGDPLVALAGDIQNAPDFAKDAFEGELLKLLDTIETPRGDEALRRDQDFVRLALLLGGLVLARGVRDPELSDRALVACRKAAQSIRRGGRANGNARDTRLSVTRFKARPNYGALDPYRRHFCEVLGATMAYVDEGQGRPLVFLNNISFTSYGWRNVVSYLQADYRCLVPDLPGSGRSGPMVQGDYRVFDQIDHIEAWLDALGLDEGVVLVGHEWGATMAFDIARRRPGRVAAICYLGATLTGTTYRTFPTAYAKLHQIMRAPGGEEELMYGDRMLERQLRRSTLRRLEEEELAGYRALWAEHGPARLPLARMILDIPIEGGPADVVEYLEPVVDFMNETPIPKLSIKAAPGWRRFDPDRERMQQWPNQQEAEVPGILLVTEDVPDQIASLVADFLDDLGL